MPVCITYSSLSTLPSRFKSIIHFNSRNVDNFRQNVDNSPIFKQVIHIPSISDIVKSFSII